MAVHVDEIDSTIETGPAAPAATAPASPSPDDAARLQRERARALRRDEERTRSEAYDD